MNSFQSPLEYPHRQPNSPPALQLDDPHPQQTPRSALFQENLLNGTTLASQMYHNNGNVLNASAISPEPRMHESSLSLDHYNSCEIDWSIFHGMDLTTSSTVSTAATPDSITPNFLSRTVSGTTQLDFPSSLSNSMLSNSYFENSFSQTNIKDAITSIDPKAADLCYRWLSNFSPCWPEEKDFAALEQLTGESVTRIKTWFSQRLSQLAPSPSFPNTSRQHLQLASPPSSSPPTPSSSSPIAVAAASRKAASPGHPRAFKAQTHCCTPTPHPERLRTRDPSRPFQCTRACGRSFPRKGEWTKHEQKSCPQRVWLCTVGAAVFLPPPSSSSSSSSTPSALADEPSSRRGSRICASCGEADPNSSHLVSKHWATAAADELENDGTTTTTARWCRKQFMRKDHLVVHLRTVHGVAPDAEAMAYYGAVGELEVGSGGGGGGGGELKGWYRWCGFCRRDDCFRGWRERVDHLGRHFKKEGRVMGEWRGFFDDGDDDDGEVDAGG